MVRPRVRIRFSKRSALRLIGHRDLMRSLERTFRRAGLPLCMSEGYRPKPRMHFPLALAVGMEGRREVMELQLHEPPAADELLARLRPQAPCGLGFESLEILPPCGAPGVPGTVADGRGSRVIKARAVNASYCIAVPPSRVSGLEEKIQRLLSASAFPIRCAKRAAAIDVRAGLLDLALRKVETPTRIASEDPSPAMEVGIDEHVLEWRLKSDPGGSAGPRHVLAALELDDLERQGIVLIRSDVEIDS
jgi:radical SAM-linked protein